MGVRRLEDLMAYQLAVQLKLQVYDIVGRSPGAKRDWRYRDQLFAAVSSVEANIAEGWRRFAPAEMSQFLRYAMGSVEETRRRLVDGAHRGHFSHDACEPAVILARRCGGALARLWKSLQTSPYRSPPKGIGRNGRKH
jgi:four helix bundle protein